MKYHLKSICMILVLCLLAGCLVACGKAEGTGRAEGEKSASSEKNKTEARDAVPFKMEDLRWGVEDAVVDGERAVVFRYTNESKVSVLELSIAFREKSDIDPAEKETLYQYLITAFSLDEEESEDLKAESFAMTAEGKKLVRAGGESGNLELNYFDGYSNVEKLAHFDYVEPDVATVRYVQDGKIHTVYYDFVSKKFSKEEKIVNSFYWTNSEIGKMIPQPETEVVEERSDEDDHFSVKAWGMDFDDFEAYRDACIEKGYTVDPSRWDGYYSACNAEGYEVSLDHEGRQNCVYISIYAPEEETEEDKEKEEEEEEEEEEESDEFDEENF